MLTGGGYAFGAFLDQYPPTVKSSRGDGANGWMVNVSNYNAGAGDATVVALAYCAS